VAQVRLIASSCVFGSLRGRGLMARRRSPVLWRRTAPFRSRLCWGLSEDWGSNERFLPGRVTFEYADGVASDADCCDRRAVLDCADVELAGAVDFGALLDDDALAGFC
jgi:hypothetical protein